ncbi:hypothetical protein, partial [Saccharopolyspora sp. 7B]|uniref:hypothetical protein n=1 Tax=Saccharopolyspora sp. 7B TaxID=2877240 RepID=UPI001CD54FCA
LYQVLYQALPDYQDRLARGGPLLDVGSGVGGALLTTHAQPARRRARRTSCPARMRRRRGRIESR